MVRAFVGVSLKVYIIYTNIYIYIYILTFHTFLKKLNPKSNVEKRAVHVKIVSTQGTSSYTFEYKLDVTKPNQPLRTEKGTAYKIN